MHFNAQFENSLAILAEWMVFIFYRRIFVIDVPQCRTFSCQHNFDLALIKCIHVRSLWSDCGKSRYLCVRKFVSARINRSYGSVISQHSYYIIRAAISSSKNDNRCSIQCQIESISNVMIIAHADDDRFSVPSDDFAT